MPKQVLEKNTVFKVWTFYGINNVCREATLWLTVGTSSVMFMTGSVLETLSIFASVCLKFKGSRDECFRILFMDYLW